jgi:hypothetical protein
VSFLKVCRFLLTIDSMQTIPSWKRFPLAQESYTMAPMIKKDSYT